MKSVARGSLSWIAAGLFVLMALGCNLLNPPPAAPPATPTAVPSGMPEATILWPPSGSEFVVRQEVAVRVSASDPVGITRLELRAPGIMLSSVPSPERSGQPSMEAILSWTPTRSGTQNLEVVAYRGGIASEPIPLAITVRSRAAEVLVTPVPFGAAVPASAPQPGTACQIRVNIDNLRYRSGPDTTYAILGLLELGETLNITGRNGSGTWYRASRNGQTVWVSASTSYITTLSDCAGAPVVE